jgi:hypothetical protein
MTVRLIIAAGAVAALTACGSTASTNTTPTTPPTTPPTTRTPFPCDPILCPNKYRQPPPPPRPRLSLDCASLTPVGTRSDFKRVVKPGAASLVEWGIDYGDGRRYVTHDAGTAERDAYWHVYQQSGAYVVRAWVINASAQRADATCNVLAFNLRGSSPEYSSDYYDPDVYDLDCADIGVEVIIDDDDPYGFDGDGDGYGCEAYG